MSKDVFKPPPFNYCDYRCDRCEHRETCRVYNDDQKRLLDHYCRGEDPYDPKIFMDDLQAIFAKTKEMIRNMADNEGIDLSSAPDEEVQEVDPEEYVVYNLAFEYAREAHDFCKKLEQDELSEAAREAHEDLKWYHGLIAAKTGRLVSGFMDDFLDDDLKKIEEDGTLSVIYKGINQSKAALGVLLNELPEHLHTIADLISLLKELERHLQADCRLKVT